MENKPKKVKTVINQIDADFKKRYPNFKLINIETDLKFSRKIISKSYIENLENQKNTLDEAIKVSISIHNLNKLIFSNEHYAHTFIVLSANITNILIGIRDNLQNGLLNCVKILYRPLIEAIHIFQACLFDDELSCNFMKMEMYDNNNFYFHNFSKRKLFDKCILLYRSLEIENKKIDYLIERNKLITKFLSESIHSSYNAAHSNYIITTLDFKISDNYYGKITTGYPKILSSLIEDLVIYNTIYKSYVKKYSLKYNINSKEYIIYDFYSDKFNLITTLYLDDFFSQVEKIDLEFRNINEF